MKDYIGLCLSDLHSYEVLELPCRALCGTLVSTPLQKHLLLLQSSMLTADILIVTLQVTMAQ